jgi:hypothetical protein
VIDDGLGLRRYVKAVSPNDPHLRPLVGHPHDRARRSCTSTSNFCRAARKYREDQHSYRSSRVNRDGTAPKHPLRSYADRCCFLLTGLILQANTGSPTSFHVQQRPCLLAPSSPSRACVGCVSARPVIRCEKIRGCSYREPAQRNDAKGQMPTLTVTERACKAIRSSVSY